MVSSLALSLKLDRGYIWCYTGRGSLMGGEDMARVLEDGNSTPHWKTQVTCHKPDERTKEELGCGAVLEVGFDDLVLWRWYGTHFEHFGVAVRCPQCREYIQITDQVPNGIYNRLNTSKNRKNAIFSGVDGR